MDTYTVSFFGHRQIIAPLLIDRKLDALIRCLLLTKPYVEFLVGRDGDFDLLVSSAIRRAKRTVRSDNSSHVWVLPYATAEYRNHPEDYHEYYDEVEICEVAAESHFKAAFQARNRAMANRSHLIVFCDPFAAEPGADRGGYDDPVSEQRFFLSRHSDLCRGGVHVLYYSPCGC